MVERYSPSSQGDSPLVFYVFGISSERNDLLTEHLFLVARYHIYASKRKNIVPKLQTFIELTTNNAEVEKRYAYETNTLANYSKKWSRLRAFLFSKH